MVKLSTEDYREALLKSKLVDAAQLDKALQELGAELGEEPDDPHVLSERLEKDGLVTRWQNEVLLEGRQDALMDGRHSGFFLGSYKLLGHLGTGGMNSVFLAEHIVMRRRAAIKVLPLKGDEDKAFLERFQRESQATAALDHPNIVRAHDFATQGQVHYLVMEHVDGKDLQRTVKDGGPLDFKKAANYTAQALLGLHHAHEAGMVHRDIKPANLLLDRKGVVKLLDLGVARLETEDASLTKEHKENILGTADYLAPEQAIDSHNVDARADIYSMGCTLYFMLTGHPPFPHGSLAQRMLMHQIQTPTSIFEDRPDAPEALVKIVEKMMSKKPEERYQTAMEAHDALVQWEQGTDANVMSGPGLGFGSETDTSLTGSTTLGLGGMAPPEESGPTIHCASCGTRFNPEAHHGRCPKCGSLNEMPTGPTGGATADLMNTELTNLGTGSGFAKGLNAGLDAGSGVTSYNFDGTSLGTDGSAGSGTASFGGNTGSGTGSFDGTGSGTASFGGTTELGSSSNYDLGQTAPPEPTAPAPSADVPHADGPVRSECPSCGATYSAPWRSCLHCGATTVVTESDSTDNLQQEAPQQPPPEAPAAPAEASVEESAADWSDEYSSDQYSQAATEFDSAEQQRSGDLSEAAATATQTATKAAPPKPAPRGRGPFVPMILAAVAIVGVSVAAMVVGGGGSLLGLGPSQETYPNGQVKSRGNVVDGQRQGEWTFFDESGQITAHGMYKDGKEVGQWSYFDEHGQLRKRGNYQDGVPNGRWVTRDPDGQVREEGDYRQNKRHGRWIFWTPDGMRSLVAEFRDGQPTGTWIQYDKEGNPTRFEDNYPPVPAVEGFQSAATSKPAAGTKTSN